jgi:hypothetical protein
MLLEPPADEPVHNFDLSLLSKRIAEVKDADAPMSTKKLAQGFIDNTIIPILNTPQIYQMLQNPNFVEQLSGLLTGFLLTAPKVAPPKPNE